MYTYHHPHRIHMTPKYTAATVKYEAVVLKQYSVNNSYSLIITFNNQSYCLIMTYWSSYFKLNSLILSQIVPYCRIITQ